MRRNVLFSLMLIGAVVALAVGATTFAPFTASDSASSGPVTAGQLEIDLSGTPDASISFSAPTCNTEMAPGDVCSETLVVTNASGTNGLAATYTIETWADSNGTDDGAAGSTDDTLVDCFNVEYDADGAEGTVVNQSTTGAVAGGSGPDADTDDLDPAEAENFLLEVAVDDDNTCQDDSATVMGIVIATQSATPHD